MCASARCFAAPQNPATLKVREGLSNAGKAGSSSPDVTSPADASAPAQPTAPAGDSPPVADRLISLRKAVLEVRSSAYLVPWQLPCRFRVIPLSFLLFAFFLFPFLKAPAHPVK